MGTLLDRLKSLPSHAASEQDALLAEVWREFKDSDAHEAVSFLCERLRRDLRKDLLERPSSGSTGRTRDWAAGATWALDCLELAIHGSIHAQAPEVEAPPPVNLPEDFVSPEVPAY